MKLLLFLRDSGEMGFYLIDRSKTTLTDLLGLTKILSRCPQLLISVKFCVLNRRDLLRERKFLYLRCATNYSITSFRILVCIL